MDEEICSCEVKIIHSLNATCEVLKHVLLRESSLRQFEVAMFWINTMRTEDGKLPVWWAYMKGKMKIELYNFLSLAFSQIVSFKSNFRCGLSIAIRSSFTARVTNECNLHFEKVSLAETEPSVNAILFIECRLAQKI